MNRIVKVTMLAIMTFWTSHTALSANAARIQPYSENAYFWQYKGEPVLLLGGSWQDNLFNHPIGLEEHLDLLASVGGNYLRNVMSHRNEGNVFAYDQVDGKFDLERWNEEYWGRFNNFLRMTHERDIIVQIEIWATWDHYEDHQSIGGWSKHPFNPANNRTYTPEESGLPTVADYPPTGDPTEHPFFSSVPALDNNELVLNYQKAYVDKLLSYSLQYPHVLYCMNNETGEDVEWSDFWARYVRSQAAEAGKQVETAEMRRSGNITTPDHRHMINHPDLYTFLDISQNNTQRGQVHLDRILQIVDMIKENPRPINNNKIYTGGDEDEAVARMFRIIFAGGASARFHRPHPLEGIDDHEKSTTWGLGLSPRAQGTIRNARAVMEEMGWPDIKTDLSFVELEADQDWNVQTEKTHVVYTRNAEGQARIYINGEKAVEKEIAGSLSAFDSGIRLALGNEFVGDRGWLGKYQYVAIYDRALNSPVIKEHYNAGKSKHLDGIQALYQFDEGKGDVVRDRSGLEPALDLHIHNEDAVSWLNEGLKTNRPVLIATEGPADRLTASLRESNAITVEAWITPTEKNQAGPARIVTLSKDHGTRNFTFGQEDDIYEMRLRTTSTSNNGLPSLQAGGDVEASYAAIRSKDQNRAAVFVTRGGFLNIDMKQFQDDVQAQWFNPETSERQKAAPKNDGYFHPPSDENWLLFLK